MTDIRNEYFEWLISKICDGWSDGAISFRNLFYKLHSTQFTFILSRDENRAKDGVDLRYRFAWENEYSYPAEIEYELNGPCSVFEMMVALALYCEENIMSDPLIGNRTPQWFRSMIVNLGLGSMSDDRFDERRADEIIGRFLDRQYDADGSGGLFTVRRCSQDLRDVEIIYQLYWYLDDIV